MATVTGILYRSMEQKKSWGMGDMEIDELQMKLNKAKEDADYWRLAYDKLIKHIDNQDKYIRHLEDIAWGLKK